MAEREGVLGETLAVFEGSTPLTTAEIADELGIDRRSTYDRLEQLVDRGAVETKNVGDRTRVWWRPDDETDGDIGVGFEDFAVWELLDALEDVVYVFDAEGTLLRWNDRLETVTGYDQSELAEMDPLDFVPDEYADTVAEAVDRVIDGESAMVEVPMVTADGERVPYEFTGAPLADEHGTVVGFTGVGRDVSERKERERQLQEERDLTERLLEAVPESVMVFDADGDVVRANRRAERRFDFETDDGYEIGDADVYDEDGEWVPPDDRPYGQVFASGNPVEDWECQVDLPGRGRRWLSVNAVPLHDESGTVEAVVMTTTDITRLKEQTERIERQRDELESELSEVFERVDDAFYAVDDEFRFAYVNGRAEDLLQHDEEELLGESVWEMFPVARETEAWDAFHEALETQEPTSYDLYYEPLEFWVEARVYPSESGLSVYFRDVTERKQWERRLRESERRYRTLAEHIPNGAVLLFDEDLRYTLVEGQIFAELDLDPADMVGQTVHEVFPDDHAGKIAPHYRAAIEGEQHSYEVAYGGREFQVRTLPLTDEDGEVMAGMSMTQDITERKERERMLERQRERLAALDEVNRVVRDINERVLEQSTREEVERTVCNRLAESESYSFAVIFESDPRSGTIEKRIEAGVDNYVERIEIDDDVDAAGQGPGQLAVETGEMQVVQHAQENPEFERWRETAQSYGFNSLAAVPLSHENVRYGVLGIYSERPEAFSGQERNVVEQLGEIVGSTIAAAQRKHALMGEEVVEIEFQLRGIFQQFDVSPTDGRIEFERIVPVGEGIFLGYGSVTDEGVETVRAITDRLPHAESVRTYQREYGDTRFELRLEDPPVASAVAAHGGTIEEVVLAEDDSHMTIHLPPGVDVREVADVVRESYPTAEMLTRRQVTESDEQRQAVRALTEELTDRQRAALEVSYYAGFFEWPRENNGDEIAESLDVSPPTFHQHLRAAQKKLLAAVFE